MDNSNIQANETTFRDDIRDVINSHARETGSNTPDFILAKYLTDCLDAFENASNWRQCWHSTDGVPEKFRENGPGSLVLESPDAK